MRARGVYDQQMAEHAAAKGEQLPITTSRGPGLVRSSISTVLSCAALGLAAALVTLAHSTALAQVPAFIPRYEVVQPRSPRSGGADGRTRLALRAFGRDFEFVLEPSPLLAPGARTIVVEADGARVEESKNNLFRGHLADNPEATVRVALEDGALVGSVREADQTWLFEPLQRYERGASPSATIVYRAADLDSSALPPGDCAADDRTPLPGRERPRTAPTTPSPRSHGPGLGLVELTLVADHAFWQIHGGDSATEMQAIVDQVDAFYRSDLDVTVQVVQTVVYAAPGLEPWSATTSPSGLLQELAAARGIDPAVLGAGDLTHLFTGRDLDQSVIGIAYVAAVCDDFYGAGLSQAFTGNLHSMTLLVGHEMGHNLGAWHDGQAASPCAAEDYGYVMWPSVDHALAEQFSTCSITSIDPVVEGATCITSAIPEGCGDGQLDPGEDCDDGGNEGGDCCRIDCRFDFPGARCTNDGNECTNDICNGTGTCAHQAGTGPCDDGNACTLDGICSAGACVSQDNLRPLSAGRLKATFGPGFDDDSLLLKGTLTAGALDSPPTVGGAKVRFLDEAGDTLLESFVAAGSWSDTTGNGTTFRYRADAAPAPEAAGLVSMQVKTRASTGVAKVKAKFSGAELGILEGRGVLGLEITLGDDVAGDCATAESLSCTASAGRLRCP